MIRICVVFTIVFVLLVAVSCSSGNGESSQPSSTDAAAGQPPISVEAENQPLVGTWRLVAITTSTMDGKPIESDGTMTDLNEHFATDYKVDYIFSPDGTFESRAVIRNNGELQNLNKVGNYALWDDGKTLQISDEADWVASLFFPSGSHSATPIIEGDVDASLYY
ncbi:MAG: hypothetical protein IPK16_05235 [Anaerolineales bacterium]|nr:hypothetical protein [Anaerolineales bacterium]